MLLHSQSTLTFCYRMLSIRLKADNMQIFTKHRKNLTFKKSYGPNQVVIKATTVKILSQSRLSSEHTLIKFFTDKIVIAQTLKNLFF